MARVIVHHAHHPDEGVYRLIHAAEVEDIEYDVAVDPEAETERDVAVPNPAYKPEIEHGDNYGQPYTVTSYPTDEPQFLTVKQPIPEAERPKILVERRVKRHVDHQDIVWADDDPRWKRKTQTQIAELQRRDVKAAIDRHAARLEEEQAAAEDRPVKHFRNSAGQEL